MSLLLQTKQYTRGHESPYTKIATRCNPFSDYAVNSRSVYDIFVIHRIQNLHNSPYTKIVTHCNPFSDYAVNSRSVYHIFCNPSYTTFRTFMKHKNRTRWITIVMHYFVYDFSYAMKFAVPYTIYCTIDDLFVYVMIFNKRDQKWNA